MGVSELRVQQPQRVLDYRSAVLDDLEVEETVKKLTEQQALEKEARSYVGKTLFREFRSGGNRQVSVSSVTISGTGEPMVSYHYSSFNPLTGAIIGPRHDSWKTFKHVIAGLSFVN